MASSLVVHASPDAIPGQAAAPVASGGPGRCRPDREHRCELLGRHPIEHLGVVDDALVAERQRQPHRRERRALRHPRLQQPQPARLDGELDVLHVGAEAFQANARVDQLGVGVRQSVSQRAKRLAVAGARHHVVALGGG